MSEKEGGDRVEEVKKIEVEERKKKVGKPRKIEELAKGRRGSTGSLDDFFIRKEMGEGRRMEREKERVEKK